MYDGHIKNHSSKHKKSSAKTNHKHNYCDCLLRSKVPRYTNSNEFVEVYNKAKYCTICGKISGVTLFELEEINSDLMVMPLTKEYMTKKYPDVNIFSIGDIWKDKYVTLVTQIDK